LIADDGDAVFHRGCSMGLEGIVAKRRDRPYKSGRSPDWVKIKNPDAATRIWNRQSRTRTVSVQIPLRNKIATIYDL
jgi:ATP-dependent DNA ligase